jgi:phosphoenolpyruvate carboxykinase (GTP)
VTESLSWEHGVFMGATIASEKTAAAEGTVGELRRDPFAMLPFCGYNMADYWGHWLSIGRATDVEKLPRLYQVNWFRKDAEGNFIWPGYGENSRVLAWVIDRLEGLAGAVETPIGRLPVAGEVDVTGLDISEEVMAELFHVDAASWLAEADLTAEYFAKFGDRVPAELHAQLDALKARLQQA